MVHQNRFRGKALDHGSIILCNNYQRPEFEFLWVQVSTFKSDGVKDSLINCIH